MLYNIQVYILDLGQATTFVHDLYEYFGNIIQAVHKTPWLV